jgi:large subunit GTPase 1
VLPRFAGSRAEMVAAGVVPIDRLTEVRLPVDVVAQRAGRRQLESAYGLRLGAPGGSNAPPKAQQLLAALAAARGWAAGGGLPDEARAGRTILKDYTAGRLVFCQLPPGSDPPGWAPSVAPGKAEALEGMAIAAGADAADAANAPAGDAAERAAAADLAAAAAAGGSGAAADAGGGAGGDGGAAAEAAAEAAAAAAAAAEEGELMLDPADLELLEGLSLDGAPAQPGRKLKQQRPDYKMHKKGPGRSKGARGAVQDGGGYDGAALAVGKKGGLLRVTGYAVAE